jgi:hypothetical protein
MTSNCKDLREFVGGAAVTPLARFGGRRYVSSLWGPAGRRGAPSGFGRRVIAR